MGLIVLIQVSGATLPPRPASGLWDESQLLTEAETHSIHAALTQARRQGVNLYVAIFPTIGEETSLRDRAKALHRQWQAGDYGIVIALEAATGDCRVFAQPPQDDSDFSQTISKRLGEASLSSETLTSPGARLTNLVEHLAQRLTVNNPPAELGSLPALNLHEWLTLVGLSTAALALLCYLWYNRRPASPLPLTPEAPPLYFPEVTVGKRLGAPFGGGVVARTTFSEPLSSQSAHKPKSEK
jgi:hypothetical protein